MKSNEYWAKRFEQLVESLLNKGESYKHAVEKAYAKATSEIEEAIQKWYMRIAKNNEITYAEARKLLTADQLKEFKWTVEEYIKYGQKNAIDAKWIKQLENASAKVHIRRLDALKIQMRQQVEMLFSNQKTSLTEAAKAIMSEGYYRSAYEIQKGLNVGWNFATLDEDRIEKLVSKPWAADGINFSDRIWNNKNKLINELNTRLSHAIIRGESPDQIIKELAGRLDVSRFKAGRVVMTESAYFASESQKQCFGELDVERYEIIATLDLHTSEICQELDKQVFKMSEYEVGTTAPPFHPWCRTTTAPYFDDMPGERAAKGADGKTYYVPGDMRYREWYNQHVKSKIEPSGVGHWQKDKNGVIIPTEIVSKRYSPKTKGKANSVIQYTTQKGKQINRDFFDENGWLVKQINAGNHGNRKTHPFGKNGEHAHYWKYESGKIVDRKAVELTKQDRIENADILE